MVDRRVVKASFRECPIEDRNRFSLSKCIMPISIGQKVHEGEKFAATIHLVNRSFESCVILIDDTIQRHTLNIQEPNKDHEWLYKQALMDGSLWLERSKPLYEKLEIPYTVIRWDKWLQHPDFPKKYAQVEELYQNEPEYKQAIDENITDYLTRYQKNNDEFDEARAFLLCLDYLKEECAGMCLWVEEGCEFELYPNNRNQAMAATYKWLIQPQYSHLLRPVALRFKKYPAKEANKELLECIEV